MNLNDTIVAQSTPQGKGAIGIIRLSGKNSIKLINSFEDKIGIFLGLLGSGLVIISLIFLKLLL